MESREYKPETWVELSRIRSENHEVILYHFSSPNGNIVTIAATDPTPKINAQCEPGYASEGYYSGYSGYANGYGYSGYATYMEKDFITQRYSSLVGNQEGKDLSVSFEQRDLSEGKWVSPPVSSIDSPITALIFVNKLDRAFMSKLFDSALPSWARRVEKGTISFIIVFDKSDTTDEFDMGLKVANWIGAVAVVPANISRLYQHEAAKTFLDFIAERVAAAKYNTEIVNRFKLMEAVRFLSLDDVKRLEASHAFDVVDPIGNSLLQLALHNPDTEVFFYLGQKYPQLLSLPNMFGETPLSSIGNMRDRFWETKFFEWRKFWTLPFEFPKEFNCLRWTDISPYPILVFELLRNKDVWIHAKQRLSNRQELLASAFAKLPLAFRGAQRTNEEALEALKLFLAEGINPEGEAMNMFVACGFLECVKYFVESGYRIPAKDIEAVFNNGWRETMEYLIDTPDFERLSTEANERIVKHIAQKGFNDLLRKVAKKGIPLPLSAINGAYLSSANIIARANAQKVISLKHLCVNELYDVHGEKNIHRAIGDVPEDVRSLFVNQNRYQWVLYLDNEKRQRLLLKLYEALSNADRVEDAMQLTIDGFTFSFKYNENYSKNSVEMWLDGLNYSSSNLHYKYYRHDYTEITSSMHYDEYTETKHEHEEILAKIMDNIGWDLSDAYVFITVLSGHLLGRNAQGEDEIRCSTFVQQQTAATFHRIPEWYSKFVMRHFGINI